MELPYNDPWQGRGLQCQSCRADWQLWEVAKGAGQGLPETGLGKTDWQVPTEVDLQDLCTGVAESEELDGIWTSLFIFVALFLFSVTYGASVTLFKVGHRPSSLDEGRLGDPARQTEPEQRPSRTPSSQVRWVLEAVLQETPQSTHDYVNIMQPEVWTHSTSSTQPGCLLPHV